VDEALLRTLTPTVIGIIVRRGADFAAAEDALQDALVEAVRVWPDDPPRDSQGWLVTAAWRKFLDAARAGTSRRHREERAEGEPVPGPDRSGPSRHRRAPRRRRPATPPSQRTCTSVTVTQ
jgi:predicted RNA polymerase sigma factor